MGKAESRDPMGGRLLKEFRDRTKSVFGKCGAAFVVVLVLVLVLENSRKAEDEHEDEHEE